MKLAVPPTQHGSLRLVPQDQWRVGAATEALVDCACHQRRRISAARRNISRALDHVPVRSDTAPGGSAARDHHIGARNCWLVRHRPQRNGTGDTRESSC